MLDIMETQLSKDEYELLQHPAVGGVILFTRNYSSVTQLEALCQSIRAARGGPLLIGVDQEGGRVQRFKEGFTRIPSMGSIGDQYEQKKESALQLAENCGWLLASELLAVGIDFSFAPVLDLYHKNNPVIGDRGFHERPDYVIPLAKALMHGMHTAGMPAVGKHFPGHGSVHVDSHFTLPVDTRSLDQLRQEDLQTFLELIHAGLDGMMPAHIIFSNVDSHPVSFSKYWLSEILRKKCKFSGMIFSDDLNMRAANVAGDYATRAAAAMEAGCDMILICNNRPAALEIVNKLQPPYFVDANKFKQLQGKFSHSFPHLQRSMHWQNKFKQVMRTTEIES
jgi:beta-N-acetylhexosaminidase